MEEGAGKITVTYAENPVLERRVFNKKPINELQHYAAIHYKKYRQQPQGVDMALITNDTKRKGHAELYTTSDLLESLSSGQSVLLSNFELDKQNNIRFISSSAFAIDVDDDLSRTDPLKVLESLKDTCTGLFYTFSHGKKGNRYRLLFQLDYPITQSDDLSILIDYMIFYLKEKGLPVDGKAKTPTQIIRGGIAGYEVNDFNTTLNVNRWLTKGKAHFAEKLKKMEEQRKNKLKDNLRNPVAYDELKEMCESIGHLPSGDGDETTQKWLQVVYAIKHQVQMELIDDNQGFELFNIVSGHESNEKYWNGIKPSGHVTVGTIVHLATESGYKRKHKYGYALQDVPETIERERISVKRYIPTDVAVDLLQRQQKLLLDSPTGSAKSTAFINAFKELANRDYHYYIFATPTIPLTEQLAKEHDLPCVTGGMKNTERETTNKAIKGHRIFVCTYDKTADLVNHLENGIDYGTDPKPEITLVIDEIHKFSEAYNYRYTTIDRLEEIAKSTVSLIGLSGTPEDILKTNFDKLIEIDTGNKKSPCTDYRVFTYDTNENGIITPENADIMLIPTIRGLLQQTRVLLFINNKDRIQRIARLLTNEEITCMTITSKDKKSSSYREIVENSEIGNDVQVVICTTVLADGISIKNSLDWSCLVVSDRESPIWNPSTIKQISNRFRNDYRYFGLYMRTPNPDYYDTKRFNIESDYQYKLKIVNNYVDYLNTEFENELLKKFIPSNVERTNGIFHRSKDETAKIEFNPLFVRHQSMRTKERYYASHRDAFIKEVGRLLGREHNGIFNVNDEVRKKGSDLSGLLSDIQEEKEEEKLEADELRANFKKYFEESTYLAFVHQDDEGTLEQFKKDVHPDQFSATFKNCKITDFETCKTLGEAVEKRADINKYVNDIRALTDIASFDYVKKVSITKRVFNELVKMELETYASSDFKEITEKQLPKKLKVSKKDVQEGLKLFHKFSSRPGGVSMTTIRPLSIELLSKVKYDIQVEAIKKSILKYIDTKSDQQQNILLPAVEKKYGVTWQEIGDKNKGFRIKY